MRNIRFIFLMLIVFFTNCYDDKGNYDYVDVALITIENIPAKIEVLGSVDNIVVNPSIKSSIEGEINEDNPNFKFTYKAEFKTGGYMGRSPWFALNENGEMNLNISADLPAKAYIVWFLVEDLRTGIKTSVTFDLVVTSATYEGWMILCNEGPDDRVRMDMVSKISADRHVVAIDILKPLGLPESQTAYGFGFYPNLFASPGDQIFVMTGNGSYRIDNETFETDESWNIFNIDFLVPLKHEYPVAYQPLKRQLANFIVTDVGNAYVQNLEGAGAAFEMPINTSSRGGTVEYKVAPYIGLQQSESGTTALFYDIDNKRFVGWSYGANVDARNILTPLSDSGTTNLFSFNTGKDLIYMESTRYSNGLVYSVLEDNSGNRSVYGINMSGTGFIKESYYKNIDAPEFNEAKYFAFHSQFPYMFYATDKNVYLYNLGTGKTYEMDVGLKNSEEITLLKFNLFKNSNLELLNDQSDEFMGLQYELIVGSYDSSVADYNGGRMSVWKVNGTNNSVSKHFEYEGFSRIIDIVYRERR